MIIISRCPCRISLLGGGSDLDWFLKEKGRGSCLGFTVPIFTRVAVGFRTSRYDRGVINYSSREEYKNIESISHPIIRTVFQKYCVNNPVELASFGDAMMGGGLGSSSSFNIALIRATNELLKTPISNDQAAKAACEVEIDNLRNPIGSQDQYLCALGGINILEFQNNRVVIRKKYPKIQRAIETFTEKLFLINSGISRSASKQLSLIKKQKSSFRQIEEILNTIDQFIDISKDLEDEKKIISNLEEAIKRSWEIKIKMKGVYNSELEQIEKELKKYKFKLLKVLGAGGGGYLLTKYIGENLRSDSEKFSESKFKLNSVKVQHGGCEIWKI